jgi:hypothetical protein
MKNLVCVGLASLAIFALGTLAASAGDTPSGLIAHIAPTTNRVSSLSHLEFSVFITNSGPTNVTIHPWVLKNGLGTVIIFDARGLIMAYQPPRPVIPRTLAELEKQPPLDLVLMPSQTYALKYKLGDHFSLATPPGKYQARGDSIPSNEVEIIIE